MFVVAVAGCGAPDPDAEVGETESDGGAGTTSDGDDAVDDDEGSDGTPLPEGPGTPQPGSCGWDGDGYGCGWAFQGPECARDVVIGGACNPVDEPPCCGDVGELFTCVCEGNACEVAWRASDCTYGPGAGTCGWNPSSKTYTCGGEGGDPVGSSGQCPDDIGSNVLCKGMSGATCCDDDGDAWQCREGDNGGAETWGLPTDCVL